MNLRGAGLVFRKELGETLRDRRILIPMVLLPFCLYPLLGVLTAEWVGTREVTRAQQSIRIAVEGEPWPALTAALRAEKKVSVVEHADVDSLRAKRIDAVIQVPEGAREQFQRHYAVNITVSFDQTRTESTQAKTRLDRALKRFSRSLLQQRLVEKNLPESFARPLRVSFKNIAPRAKTHRHMLADVLPLLIVLMVLLGAFYPAIDLTAGEKERGTLETLLVAPVSRIALMTGKVFAVAGIATLTGVVNVIAVMLTATLGFGALLEGVGVEGRVIWIVFGSVVLGLIPVAFLFAALSLATCAWARSLKEAQVLLSPLYLLCVVPALVIQSTGVALTPLTACIPVANVTLLLREFIRGDLTPGMALLVVLSTGVFVTGALVLAARIFSGERLLVGGDLQMNTFAAMPSAQGVARPGDVAVVVMVIMGLVAILGSALQFRDLALGILITEWVFIALPVMMFLKWRQLEPRRALAWRNTEFPAYLGAVLLGVSAWYVIGVVVEGLQQHVLPVSREIEEMARRLFTSDRGLTSDIVLFALSPAICEELLFRGLILRSSRGVLSERASILTNGLLFGLFHLSLYRMLPTSILGMILAWIALRTGSIFPGMVFHLLNNTCAVIVGRIVFQRESTEVPLAIGPFFCGLAIFLLGVWILRKIKQAPEGLPYH